MGKLCKTCSVEFTETEFYRVGKYLHSSCKSCHNKRSQEWGRSNPESLKRIRRKTKLKEKYGISVEDYEQMFQEQGGVCKLCEQEHKRRPLGVDHCHKTGKVRGLLCDKCNMAIGLFDDNAELLQRTINYLKETS